MFQISQKIFGLNIFVYQIFTVWSLKSPHRKNYIFQISQKIYGLNIFVYQIYHHHHKQQGLDPLIRSVSIVTTALANVSSVFQLSFFLVVCSDMISKGSGLVAFFASVKPLPSVFRFYIYCMYFILCI